MADDHFQESRNTTANFFLNIKKSNSDIWKETFINFDKDKDGSLNFSEFDNLLSQLFCHKDGSPYHIPNDQKTDIFEWFDRNKNGLLDTEEFHLAWKHWIYEILNPVSAFLIIDVQNDFISGSLSIKNCPAKHDGNAVVPVINNLLDTVHFDAVVYSLDWHPANHCSFIDNIKLRKLHKSSLVNADNAKVYDTVIFEGPPVMEQKLWPRHCIQESWGAELHKDLKQVKDAIIIKKGINPNVDSYSAFWDNKKLGQTALLEKLRDKRVTDVYICGIAYDVCVEFTAMDALQHRLRTIVIDDATKGIDLKNIEKAKKQLVNNHAVITSSRNVPNLVSAEDRPFALGYQSALKAVKELNLI